MAGCGKSTERGRPARTESIQILHERRNAGERTEFLIRGEFAVESPGGFKHSLSIGKCHCAIAGIQLINTLESIRDNLDCALFFRFESSDYFGRAFPASWKRVNFGHFSAPRLLKLEHLRSLCVV